MTIEIHIAQCFQIESFEDLDESWNPRPNNLVIFYFLSIPFRVLAFIDNPGHVEGRASSLSLTFMRKSIFGGNTPASLCAHKFKCMSIAKSKEMH